MPALPVAGRSRPVDSKRPDLNDSGLDPASPPDLLVASVEGRSCPCTSASQHTRGARACSGRPPVAPAFVQSVGRRFRFEPTERGRHALVKRGNARSVLEGAARPEFRRRLCQSFPVGITVAGSTISKTVRPCARGR
jgi:hypothetical protein